MPPRRPNANRSDEATSFYFAVYAAVQEVPHGKVTSYGHIAQLIGMPQRPRQVGVCLKYLPEPGDAAAVGGSLARFHSGTVPWQRVLNSKGVISPRGNEDGGDGRRRQAAALRAEGVEVHADAMGELSVDLRRFGWFPRRLPSELAEGLADGEEEDENDEEQEEEEEEREGENEEVSEAVKEEEVEIKTEEDDREAEIKAEYDEESMWVGRYPRRKRTRVNYAS